MTDLEILTEAIVSLLEARDFLGYQLSHANGGMTDAQLEEIAERYLWETTDSEDVLLAKTKVLIKYLGERCDSEVLATILHCPIGIGIRLLRTASTQSEGDTRNG